MGYQSNARVIYIIVCLLLAAFFIHNKSSIKEGKKKIPLVDTFSTIEGWKTINDVDLQQEVVQVLNLDDYLYRSFRKDNSIVFLYIGYYHSAAKIGAAHSPLVCFPGQGWEVTSPEKINIESHPDVVKVEKLIARKGQQQELLLYWFQSYDKTSNGTFSQKMHQFWGRLNSKPEDNAFVRVSVPVQENNIEAAYKTARKFVKDFYPHFIQYLRDGYESSDQV